MNDAKFENACIYLYVYNFVMNLNRNISKKDHGQAKTSKLLKIKWIGIKELEKCRLEIIKCHQRVFEKLHVRQ